MHLHSSAMSFVLISPCHKMVGLWLISISQISTYVTELKSIGFTYSGATGPQRWGRLSPYFSACNGKKQSPLNLAKDHVVRMSNFKPLTRNYLALNATLYNNGFNIGVLVPQLPPHFCASS